MCCSSRSHGQVVAFAGQGLYRAFAAALRSPALLRRPLRALPGARAKLALEPHHRLFLSTTTGTWIGKIREELRVAVRGSRPASRIIEAAPAQARGLPDCSQ